MFNMPFLWIRSLPLKIPSYVPGYLTYYSSYETILYLREFFILARQKGIRPPATVDH